jgi:hypothetical protein
MSYTFQSCTSLTQAPTIPSSVTTLQGTFKGCSNLTGTVTIHANPPSYGCTSCFADTLQPITLIGSSTVLSELAATAENGNVTVGE